MVFEKKPLLGEEQECVKIPVFLPRRSAVLLEEECRFRWHHGIRDRKYDISGGIVVPRSLRVSLTYRKVRLDHSDPCRCGDESLCASVKR